MAECTSKSQGYRLQTFRASQHSVHIREKYAGYYKENLLYPPCHGPMEYLL